MNPEITQDQFEAWRHHPVTIRVMNRLVEFQVEQRESIEEVASQPNAERAYGIANRRAGYVSGLQQVLTMQYEDLFQQEQGEI